MHIAGMKKPFADFAACAILAAPVADRGDLADLAQLARHRRAGPGATNDVELSDFHLLFLR
jgi:hypothetical protein